jgi:hypothetical protein
MAARRRPLMARSSATASAGNGLAIKHGAKSDRILEFNAALTSTEIEQAIASSGNYLTAGDAFLVDRAARQLTRLRLLDEYLDRLGGFPIDARGRTRKCMDLLLALERQFLITCSALGLSPQARAALAASTGMAKVQQRRLAEEAQARLRASVAADMGVDA